jgi:hypothetical protein
VEPTSKHWLTKPWRIYIKEVVKVNLRP